MLVTAPISKLESPSCAGRTSAINGRLKAEDQNRLRRLAGGIPRQAEPLRLGVWALVDHLRRPALRPNSKPVAVPARVDDPVHRAIPPHTRRPQASRRRQADAVEELYGPARKRM